MSTKTISLSLPAYERLRHARRRPAESFSQVILRAEWPEDTITGGELMRMWKERPPAYGTPDLDAIEQAKRTDRAPEDKWQTK